MPSVDMLGAFFFMKFRKIFCWINPTPFIQEGLDTTSYFTGHDAKFGDISKSLLANLEMMNAQYANDENWYNAHESASARMNELLAAGFNPLSAGRAILSSPTVDTTAPSASTLSQDPNSTANAVANLVSAANGGVAAMVNSAVSKAQIDNLNAQSALYGTQAAVNQATAPTIAPESASRVAKNNAEAASAEADVPVKTAQVGVLNAQQQEILSKKDLNDQERKQIEQVMSRYDEVTDAQINNWTAQTELYWEQKNTEKHKQYNLDANSLLLGAQTSESYQRAANLATEQAGQEIQNLINLTSAEFIAQTGIPMNASDIQTVEYYEKRGEYDKAKNYMQTILDCAAARESGVQSVQVEAETMKDFNKKVNEEEYYHPKNGRDFFINGILNGARGGRKYMFFNPQ